MTRSPESIKRHYEAEKELADQLRNAPPEKRRELYVTVYDELFKRVPDHPQLEIDHERRLRILEQNYNVIRAFAGPGDAFMEIGAGDASLSLMIAEVVKKVIALDVTDALVKGVKFPGNMEFRVCDGIHLPAEPGSIDLAFSHQLMEHLHPDDAALQLKSVYQTLRPGGTYVCVTPSRLYGPHDVSKYFDEEARGLHLKEYAYGELIRLFKKAGFRRFKIFFPRGKGVMRWPLFLPRLAEALLDGMPRKKRMKIANFPPVKILLAGSNLRLAAVK